MSEPVKLRAHNQAHCKDCSLAPLCLPLSLNLEDMDALDEIVKRGRPLKKGEFLFRQGDTFGSVYAVRSGALKTFSLSDSGEEQITGFHLPSELVGLSGMDTEAYPVSAQALETTSVCEIPFERLDELALQLPQLRRQLMRVMSREIRDDQQMMLLLSKKTADERIATFLVNLSARFRARGFSPNQFRLSMSRNEIGNYLGLAVETVSRVFTVIDFPKPGVIFRDITPLYQSPRAMRVIADSFIERYVEADFTHIGAMDARGFLIGSVLAHQLNKPLILFRKQGKLPADVIAEGYQTEYGEAFLEAHADSLCEGDSLLIVDDLIATGGTLIAAANLARRMGATVFEAAAIIDLPELGGSKRLNDIGISTFSLTEFSLTE